MRRTVYFLISLLIYINAQAQEYVDLGLSVNWATYNVGATSVEEVGIPFVVGTTIKWERKNNMTVDYLIGHREDFFWKSRIRCSSVFVGKWVENTYRCRMG